MFGLRPKKLHCGKYTIYKKTNNLLIAAVFFICSSFFFSNKLDQSVT